MSGSDRGGGNGGRKGKESREGTSPLEWAVAGVSALLVGGAAAFLVHDAVVGGSSSPPRITIEVDTIVPAGAGWLVEFRARNDGQTTAAGLLVEGEIRSDTGTVEKSEVTIGYVPAEGRRKAGLYFSEDPSRYTLVIRPKGYDRP